jgi:hypothetical protein
VVIPTSVTQFAIIGQGAGSTILRYDADVDGIYSQYGDPPNNDYRIKQCIISGFTMLYTPYDSTKTAIRLWGDYYGSYENPNITIRDVHIRYTDSDTCWTTLIHLINSCPALIENCFLRRQSNGRNGIGILLESGQNVTIRDCFIQSCEYAIKLEKADNDNLIKEPIHKHGCEDIRIVQCGLYIFKYGIWLGYKCFACNITNCMLSRPSNNAIVEDISQGAECGGYHSIIGCYIDADANMIYGEHLIRLKRPGTRVIGCFIGGDYEAPANTNGVTLTDDASRSIIQGNLIGCVNTGVWAFTSSNIISNNQIGAQDNAVLLWWGADNNIVIGNAYTNTITNNGANNDISHNIHY